MRIKLGSKYIDRSLVLFMVAFYTFLKVYRNSVNYADTTMGGLWNVVLVLLTFTCIGFLFTRSKEFSPVIRLATAYVIVLWINGLLTISVNSVNELYYYIVAPSFALVLVCLYKIMLNDNELNSMPKWWDASWILIYALLLYTYIVFFGSYKYYQSSDKIALNNSYYAACSMPFFIRYRNRFGYLMIFIGSVIVFISNKRAGLIGIGIAFIVYYLVNAKLSNSTIKAVRRLLIGLLLLVAIFSIFVYLDKRFSLSVFSRLMNIFEDGGSGRREIYNYVMGEILNSNPYSFVFGHGVASINYMSMRLSSAHNDFLNIFYEYGITALIVIFLESSVAWVGDSTPPNKNNN